MSDFFNEALKGGLDSLTADQLDELIIMAQAKRSESKGKKEIKRRIVVHSVGVSGLKSMESLKRVLQE